ncbi:hypothetical protein Y032_0282g1294, partial [Ancylostoma ceylanicum]
PGGVIGISWGKRVDARVNSAIQKSSICSEKLPTSSMDKLLIYGGLPMKYQCTNESRTMEPPNIPLGVYSMIFGAVFIPLYILCLAALIQRDLRVMVVYKIMFLLGVCDIVHLICNSLLTGFFFIKGVVFCTNPLLMYVIGCISNGFWGASCIGCFCLVFTRLIDLWSRNLHNFLFGGRRAYAVILICLLYAMCFFLFPSPGLFNAKYHSWLFDPVVDDSGKADVTWLITTNNMLTVTSTFVLYIAFFLSFLYKYTVIYGYRMTSHEKQMFIQSCAISGANVTLALLYVYMLYFPVTFAITISALFLWQFSSAGAAVIYIGINKSVRDKVLRMFIKKKTSTASVLSTAYSWQ